MDLRSKSLLGIRPEVELSKFNSEMCFDERFQNRTLRPVIEMQKQLLTAAFKNYIAKHKNVFHELSLDNRLLYIERAIQKDIKFRNSLKGMVIGQFTVEEYGDYISNSSALNKRMMNMVIEGLKDRVLLLEREAVLEH